MSSKGKKVMHVSRRFSLSCLSTALALCLTPLLASGQQNNREGNPAIQTTAQDLTGWKILESEPRLKVKVSFSRRVITLAEALRTLGAFASVKLAAEEKELGHTWLSFSYKAMSVQDILDSVASLNRAEWVRGDGKQLILRYRANPLLQAMNYPHTEEQAEIFRKGKEFIAQLGKQSPEFQDAIKFDMAKFEQNPLIPQGIPFGNLPSTMQQALRDMVAAHLQDAQNSPAFQHISLLRRNGLEDARVHLTETATRDLIGYSLDIGIDGQGNDSFHFNVFRDPKSSVSVVPLTSPKELATYVDKEDIASREEALKNDPRFKKRFTLVLHDATLADALHQLMPLAQISFGVDSGPNALRKSFNFQEMPLGDLLDRLAKLYKRTTEPAIISYTWGLRKSGIVVFHSASEPNPEAPPVDFDPRYGVKARFIISPDLAAKGYSIKEPSTPSTSP